jgi:hypothetical protein
MIQKNGYFVKFSALIDEQVCLALFDHANKLSITPDSLLEQLIEAVF